MKCTKTLISLVVSLAALAAIVSAVIIFQEELTKFAKDCKSFCTRGAKEEFEDFADV